MEWQPISTAPTDQEEVLVYVPDESPPVFTAMCIMGIWCYSRLGSYAPIDDFFGDAPLKPTTWQPLPLPPNASTGRSDT